MDHEDPGPAGLAQWESIGSADGVRDPTAGQGALAAGSVRTGSQVSILYR